MLLVVRAVTNLRIYILIEGCGGANPDFGNTYLLKAICYHSLLCPAKKHLI